jgi:hypothetical protein
MKTILSSKYLYNRLKEIDFDNDSVLMVAYSGRNRMSLHTACGKVVHLNCDCEERFWVIDQNNRRWDCVKDLCKKMPDQPIVLIITVDHVKISVDY